MRETLAGVTLGLGLDWKRRTTDDLQNCENTKEVNMSAELQRDLEAHKRSRSRRTHQNYKRFITLKLHSFTTLILCQVCFNLGGGDDFRSRRPSQASDNRHLVPRG